MIIKNAIKAYELIKNDFPIFSKSDVYELIEHISKKKYDLLVLNPNEELQVNFFRKYLKIKVKLKKGVPIAYITKNKMFCGLNFKINNKVLIPRNESELIVQYACNFLKNKKNIKVLDLCCGSGCIGISTVYLNRKSINKITFADISKAALKITKQNNKLLNLKNNVKFIKGDFLDPFINKEKFDLILCNPPYIKYGDLNVSDSVFKYEPHISLFAKEEGLYFYKKMFANIEKLVDISKPFNIIFEIGWDQKEKLEKLISLNPNIKYEFKEDFSKLWRNLIISNK
ncbi:peptide chain release factor N(5)-glutamine methyltransferase [Mesoplasma corruscae]|uniref:peptide chain release factor N(5)-glutamine methyltransferase n=1 Tax=Mesoplasma corruscae TaxID=216874 RepID=A0A2S5RHD9_9MOLU|nr:peptide chain release factor N(5)-glutamine methyltransferase [Mesoplasma corruscae]PPE06708.1 N5-glutamine S-adenosyl-L-methionine-dependent methyltransferase [Mesoplasma corruscae]